MERNLPTEIMLLASDVVNRYYSLIQERFPDTTDLMILRHFPIFIGFITSSLIDKLESKGKGEPKGDNKWNQKDYLKP